MFCDGTSHPKRMLTGVKARFAQQARVRAADRPTQGHQLRGTSPPTCGFCRSRAANRIPKVDGREGKKSVDLICAIYESNRTGRVVELTG